MSEGVEVTWWAIKATKNPNYTRHLKGIFLALDKPLKSFTTIFMSGDSYTWTPNEEKSAEQIFDKLIELYED